MKSKRREIITRAFEKIPEWATIKNRIATDFSSNLIVVGGINSIDNSSITTKVAKGSGFETQPTLSISVPDIKEDGTLAEGKDGASPKVWIVQFRAVKAHHMDRIIQQLSSPMGSNLDDGEKYETMQALNIFLGHYARMSDDVFLKSNGQRNKLWHSQTERYNMQQGIEAIKGFISSVRYSTGRILLNVNNAAISGYRPINLWEAIQEFNGGTDRFHDSERFIKALKIHRDWLDKPKAGQKGRSKDKSVWGYAHVGDGGGAKSFGGYETVQVRANFCPPDGIRFLINSPTYVTVPTFWAKTYPQFPIRYPKAPAINIGSRQKPVFVPAEYCTIVDGQDYRSKLAGMQTEAMLHFAVSRPNFNLRYIEERSPPVLGLDSSLLKTAGITIKPKLVVIKARILQPPVVNYANQKRVTVFSGGWNMSTNKVIKPGTAPRDWKFIAITTNTFSRNAISDEIGHVAQKFADELKKLGILSVTTPAIGQDKLDETTQTSFDKSIVNLFEKYRSFWLFLVLPNKLPEFQYKRIKYHGDVLYGVNTVCMQGAKLCTRLIKGGSFLQYCANVGLKVNLKLGGANQGPDTSKLSVVATRKTMLVGLDVTHPAPGTKSTSQSVAAMVANIDGSLGQWPATIGLNGHRVEEVGIVEKMLLSRLELWKTKGGNAELPKYIMLFRDGVSEGQFQRVLRYELPQIKEAIRKKYPPAPRPQPLLFIAICGKRHQVRFGPTRPEDQDGGGNLNPGMVVDSGITESGVWDFYLQAHKALKGTAKSCHYTVIHDEIFSNKQALAEFTRGSAMSKADVLQEFCNAMAYTYPRATKAVSLATPAKLADLACDRARAYVSSFIDAGGEIGGAAVGTAEAEEAARKQQDAVVVHHKLRDTMFYV